MASAPAPAGGTCPPLARPAHIAFIASLDTHTHTSTLEYVASQHLRVSGVYWGYGALHILGSADTLKRDEIAAFVSTCWDASGRGFGGSRGHDAHVLYTLSALQLLAMVDGMEAVDAEAVVQGIKALQRPDGSFAGDKWGEIDTRFTYCALSILALLGRLHEVNVPAAVDFVISCRNLDGGFGAVPGGESHAGQVFCCIGALSIADGYLRRTPGSVDVYPLDRIDADLLGWWLAERQCDGGGLNGRPEKQSDVCYSWWILSALHVLGRTHWIQRDLLAQFIYECQDPEAGGIADRPGNMTDVFHTFFGMAGLSLLGKLDGEEWHDPVDGVYALPRALVAKLNLPFTVLACPEA